MHDIDLWFIVHCNHCIYLNCTGLHFAAQLVNFKLDWEKYENTAIHESHKSQSSMQSIIYTEECLWLWEPCKIFQRFYFTVWGIFTLRGLNGKTPGLSPCFPPKSSSYSRPFSYFYFSPPHLLAFYGHLALGEILISRLYSRPASDLFFSS